MTGLILMESALLVGSLFAGFATVAGIKRRRAARARRQSVPA